LNSEGAAAERRTERDANRTIALAALASLIVVGFALMAIRRRAAYTAEKNVADALRRAFDPKTLPDTKSIRFSAKSLPAARSAEVGGDWCDAYLLPDGRFFFSVGDVAGHGLGATVGMGRVRQSLLAASLSDVQRAGLVTAICGFVDPVLRTVTYACAGHPLRSS
jgi:serine phosphatase RsbU (regulator of sigma subunit)